MKRNLILFTSVVLASGWIGWGVDVLMDRQPPETPGLLIWIAAPLAMAFVLRAFGGDGWRDLGIKPRLSGNVMWYAVAVIVYPAVTAVILLAGGAAGAIEFSNFSLSTLSQGAAVALAPMFVKNIFEEFAWRGYLTPKIHELGVNDLYGHVFVGVVWGLWHLPYFLYFLDPTVIRSYTSLSLGAFVGLGLLSMVSWALVYGELRLITGSIWPAVLMHMVEDSFLNELLLQRHIRIAPGSEWLLSPGAGLINIALFTSVGFALYRWRTSRTNGDPSRSRSRRSSI